MDNNQLSKLIESLIYESLKTQKNKYGEDKIESIKELDPSKSYKYIDAIQKFIYNDNINKKNVKKYIDIYNDKLNKNLVDNEHRDINQFKSFDEFKKYVDLIEDVKSNTEIKKQNRSIINKQYLKTIHTDHGKYKGTYDIYVPFTMEQSIELQGRNTKWCTQIPDKNENWFSKYRFIDNITIYYFVNKDDYTTMITNHKQNNEYKQVIMFQISIDKHNKVIDIRDNADKKIDEYELYELSGIKQNDYKWQTLPDGHYDVNNKGKRLIFNYKNGEYDGEYIEYYKNGNLYIKQHYKDGERNGEQIEYNKDGKILKKEYYKNSKRNGEYIEYYENGNISEKQNYKNGKYDGEYIDYYDNGNIIEKKYYKNGEIIDGEYIEYFPNGKIYRKEHYKNGQLNGEYIEYYENGKINIKQNYKDANKDGEYIEYDENGKIISKKYYKDGKLIDTKSY